MDNPSTIPAFNNASAPTGQSAQQLEELRAGLAALERRAMTTAAPAPESTPLEALGKRDLAMEKATTLGFTQMLSESTPDGIKGLAQDMLKNSLSGKTWELDHQKRETDASSNTLVTPIRVKPCSGGSVEFDEFNNAVTTGALLIIEAEQQLNDFGFMKFGLARILAAKAQEVTTAEKYKGATIAPAEKSCAELELTEAKEKVAREKERLQSAVFHLSVVRRYIATATAAASTLEGQAQISVGDRTEIIRLRESSAYLHEVLHAIYDFDRSRLMGWYARLNEHQAVKSRYQTVIGQIPNHTEFILDDASLERSPDFTAALNKLLYKKEAPQLEEALKEERLRFGEKVPPVVVTDSTSPQPGYFGWFWGTKSSAPAPEAVIAKLTAEVEALKTAGSTNGKPVDATAAQSLAVVPPPPVRTDDQAAATKTIVLPPAPIVAKVTHLGSDTAGPPAAEAPKSLLGHLVDFVSQ